jgi:hypothetical protein
MAPAASSSSNIGKSSSAGRGVAAHQLSNGLYVSGTAERNSKDSKAHRMGVSQMPYTGGNILDSGEIGKMLNIQATATTPTTPTTHNNNAAGNKKTRSSSSSCQESRSCPASPSAQSNLRSSSFNAAYTSHINNTFTSPTIIHCNSTNGNSHSRSHSHSSRTTPFIPARGMTGSQSPSLAATGLITGLAASGSGRKANVVVLGNGTTQLQNESHISATTTTTTATAASPSPGNSSRTLLTSPGASFDRTHGSGQNHGAVAAGSVPNNNNNNNESVNNLSHVKSFSFMKSIPRLILWSIFSLFVILFAIGAFVLEAAKSVVVLVVVGILLGLVCALLAWNSWWGRQSLLSFVGHHPQSDLRNAKDGQMVCITGVRELSLKNTLPPFPFFFPSFLHSFLFFSLDHHHPPNPGVIFTFGTRIKTVFFF